MMSSHSSTVAAAGFFTEQPMQNSNLEDSSDTVRDGRAGDADDGDVIRSSSGFFGRPHDIQIESKRHRARWLHHKRDLSSLSGDHISSSSDNGIGSNKWQTSQQDAHCRASSATPSTQQTTLTQKEGERQEPKTADRKIVSGFKKLILEEEINEFFNSKVHDDPFARSYLPYALRFRGGIFWHLVPQMCVVGGWSTLIVCISILKTSLGISSVLITMLGFVTGLSLSFRVNTAYERYNEGRKYWAQLTMTVRNFSRFVWIQVPLRKGHEEADFLKKIVALRLMVGFAIALKHHLREELGTDYDDLRPFVEYLPTYSQKRASMVKAEAARHAAEQKDKELEDEKLAASEEVSRSFDGVDPFTTIRKPEEQGILPLKREATLSSAMPHLQRTSSRMAFTAGEEIKNRINHSMHQWFPSNPKISEYLVDRDDRISQATVVHGNLPIEILQFLAYYCRELQHEQQLLAPPESTYFFTFYNGLTEILTGCVSYYYLTASNK